MNPFPGASFGINHFFSYIAQAMVAAFDQNSLDNLLQLLKTAGDNTAMPSFMAPVQILCYFVVQIMLGLASAILFVINCSAFILYGVTALFGPDLHSAADDARPSERSSFTSSTCLSASP